MSEKQIHNFINKHTAFGILLLVIGCFLAGYFIGTHSRYGDNGWNRNNGMMKGGQFDSVRNY
jgi:hypothetical protein